MLNMIRECFCVDSDERKAREVARRREKSLQLKNCCIGSAAHEERRMGDLGVREAREKRIEGEMNRWSEIERTRDSRTTERAENKIKATQLKLSYIV